MLIPSRPISRRPASRAGCSSGTAPSRAAQLSEARRARPVKVRVRDSAKTLRVGREAAANLQVWPPRRVASPGFSSDHLNLDEGRSTFSKTEVRCFPCQARNPASRTRPPRKFADERAHIPQRSLRSALKRRCTMKPVLMLAFLLTVPVTYAATQSRPRSDATSLAPGPIKRRWSISKSSRASNYPPISMLACARD